MNIFNRLANREFLVMVAIVASAITLHVRQHVAGNPVQSTPASGAASYGRICEPPAGDAKDARMLPADCGIRAKARTAHDHALWV